MKRNIILICIVIAVVGICLIFFLCKDKPADLKVANTEAETESETAPTTEAETESETAPTTEAETESETAPTTEAPTESYASTMGKTAKGYSIVEKDGVTYVGGILIANKTYALPASYDPGEILPETQNAFNEMQQAAAEGGINLWICSGYRSYQTQVLTYQYWVDTDSRENADRYSARPGHSEHQTGLGIDLNSVDDSFADTEEARWIAEHCSEYGFILRYPKSGEAQTGYMYEPWHLRYLGKELAKEVTRAGVTLEEYLGITSQYP